MLDTRNQLLYKAFGLTISSDVELPELIVMEEQTGTIDVEIRMEDVTAQYCEWSGRPNQFVVREHTVMFQIPDMATFSIENGKFIKVTPMEKADPDELRLLVLGTCMGSILMQRNIFPLHGSAVAVNGKAYAIVGDSGAGKSTLASAFMEQGYPLLSDDVIAVTLSREDNTPYVTPSYPQQKLWQDSLQRLGLKTDQYRSVYGRLDKYSVPVSSRFCSDPMPLAGVFELVKSDEPFVQCRPIGKLDRIHTLFSHTYRNFLIPSLGLTDWHFRMSAAMVNRLDMFQLRRPQTGFTAPQLVTQIMEIAHRRNGDA